MEPSEMSRDELRAEVTRLRRQLAARRSNGATSRPEEEPREFGERYRDFVEHITNIFYSHTADHVLTYISPQISDLLGMAPEEVLGRWTELVTDNPVNERGFELTQRALDTGERQVPYELELHRKDGGSVWVEVHEAPVLRDGKAVAIVGALTDITLRKRMEELLHLELRLGLVLNTVHDIPQVFRHALDAAVRIGEVDCGGFYLLDAATGDLELVCHRGLSEQFLEGVRHVPSTDVRRQKVEGAADHFEYVDERCREEGLLVTAVFPVLHEDRLVACLNVASRTVPGFSPPVLDALRTIGGLVGPALSRVRAEASLKRSERTLRGVLRSAPAGIGIVTDRVFQWANEYMALLTGYTTEELVGQDARVLYESDEEYERVGREKYRQIAETGAGSVETRWLRRDGTVIDVMLSSSALDPANLRTGVVFTAWDTTERRRAEEERLRLEAQVQHAQKLESLGVLAGGIAHDFNNILHAVLGNTDLAARQIHTETRAHRHLQRIRESVERASSLCNQLLAYSGKGSFVVRRVHLGEVVHDIADMLEVSISKKAALEIDVARDLPAVQADASQLRQVVMNLITNASESLGSGSGAITLSIGTQIYDRDALRLDFPDDDLQSGPFVRLDVIDTGCGMDAKTLNRIFEPFFTTKFAGRGLGMAAVQGIVRGHGGGIRIRSTPGRGTTVTVILPVVEGRIHVSPEPPLVPRSGHATGTVLFVDDQAVLRALGETILQEAGFQVLTAANGREAVDLYRELHESITCIVLDLTMPEMDGAEALNEIRAIRADATVIVCSGYSKQEILDRFGTQTPSAFLQKPFGATQLLRTLDTVLCAQDSA